MSYSSRSFHPKEITGRGDKVTHTHVVGKEKRCDSTFAYQQLMYDMSREIVHYTSRYVALAWVHIYSDGRFLCTECICKLNYTVRKVLRELQAASGTYGMVAVPDKTTLLHSVVGRFATGATVRVVQPAEVIRTAPWILEDNRSCGLRITYDLAQGTFMGALTVRVCWCTIVYRDEVRFAQTHFVY